MLVVLILLIFLAVMALPCVGLVPTTWGYRLFGFLLTLIVIVLAAIALVSGIV